MPDTLHFGVASESTGEVYDVVFTYDGASLTATCSCEAGRKGTYCKHRLRLLPPAVTKGLVRGGSDELERLASWIPGTPLARALDELAVAEAAVEAAKREVSRRKKALGRIIDGI